MIRFDSRGFEDLRVMVSLLGYLSCGRIFGSMIKTSLNYVPLLKPIALSFRLNKKQRWKRIYR